MSLIANDETPERVDPGEGPLDHPPVFAQMFAAFDAAPGNSRRDAPGAEVTAAATEVIAFVGVKFGRPFAGSAAWLANRMDGVDDIVEGHAVVAIGPGQSEGEGQAAPIHHDMALGARLAAIGRVRADDITPLFAATEEESTEARDQSIWPARLSRSSIWR